MNKLFLTLTLLCSLQAVAMDGDEEYQLPEKAALDSQPDTEIQKLIHEAKENPSLLDRCCVAFYTCKGCNCTSPDGAIYYRDKAEFRIAARKINPFTSKIPSQLTMNNKKDK